PRRASTVPRNAGSSSNFQRYRGKPSSFRCPTTSLGADMSDKTASVHWEGRGKKGAGRISTQTDALKSYPYGFASRFEDDRRGTNPEELLAAAHAPGFTLAFCFASQERGV